MFSRSEKWLGQPPVTHAEKWSTREQEVAGFADYVVSLQSWAELASVVFAEEIGMCVRWPDTIWQHSLNEEQKTRSVRLYGLLKAAFLDHARATLMIQAFSEGLPLDGSLADPARSLGNVNCGYELLRQLAQQFSLRSRAEALSMRSELLHRIFALRNSEMNAATMVGDVIRKIDIEVSRYAKLLGTLPTALDRQGLSIGDGDMLVILLRSLPEEAKKYVLHHSGAETYQSCRSAALRFERQQRLFLDLNLSPGKKQQVYEVFDMTAWDDDGQYECAWPEHDGAWHDVSVSSAVSAERCGRCGRKNHKTENCSTDMSKVKCFSCGELGHISAQCSKARGSASSSGKGKGKEKGKERGKGKDGKGKDKGKGKAKGKEKGAKGPGKGKKGKMFELVESLPPVPEHPQVDEGWGAFVWDEGWSNSWDEQWADEIWNAAAADESVGESLQLSAVLPVEQPVCLEPLVIAGLRAEARDGEWWLLDSGAGVTVLSLKYAEMFGVYVDDSKRQHVGQEFSAANGSSVRMLGERTMSVELLLENGSGENTWHAASMNVWVGDTNHNIISTTMLCFRGWSFSQNCAGIALATSAGLTAKEVTLFGNVPWLRLKPLLKPSQGSSNEVELSLSSISAEGGVLVAPVTRSTQAELAQHRLQGHTPYHPGCRHCQVARTVFQHRKRVNGRLESEVVADFFYLSSTGEDHRQVRADNLRVLVLVERMSMMTGAILTSGDLVATRTEIVKWLREFGLESGSSSVLLITDAEGAVSDLVTGASGEFSFQVRKAGPQHHEAVGVAERGVRRIKESLQTLRSDLNQEGLDLCYNHGGFASALCYVCGSLNRFSKAHGSDMAPCDLVLGRPSPKGPFTLFGAIVLAELPQSIKDLAPNLPRFTESAFLHPILGSQAIKVRALIRVEGQLVLKTFAATSVKLCVPLTWRLELVEGIVGTLGGGPQLPSASEEREVLEPPVSLRAPASGPPAQWVRTHGYTEGCSACDNARHGRRLGGAHTRACHRRYERWLTESMASDGARVAMQPPLDASREAGSGSAEAGRSQQFETNVESDERRLVLKDEGREEVMPIPVGIPAPMAGRPPSSSEHESRPEREQRSGGEVSTRGVASGSTGDEPELKRVRVVEPASPSASSRPSLLQRRPAKSSEHMQVDEQGSGPRVPEQKGVKRHPDVELVDLEDEIRASGPQEPRRLEGLCWSSNACESVLLSDVVTSPSMFDVEVNSIRFRNGSQDAKSESFMLGGRRVLIWKPDAGVDDSTLEELPGDLVFSGMQEELTNLERCQTGRAILEHEVKILKAKNPSLRLIPARWVCARKNPTRVRCRIVAKDLAHGSARKQGFSSPTPSHDAMMLTLIFMATRDMQGCAADIGHAFMNSPLDTKSNPVVLKLPLSISSEDGQAIFFFLYCALNGLRDASLAWLKLLSSLIRPLGLLSDAREPCLFAGVVWHKDRSSRVMIVCYVDDLLIITDDQWAEDLVLSAIGKRVTVKVTGRVKTSSQGGGMVEFIGRCIRRWPGQSAVEVGVKPEYLQSCFDAFGIQKGTTAVPDLAGLLEKTGAPVLTSEAYSRFRRVLGKVLWYAQTRQDLKLMIGLISTQQAAPTQSTEAALRALLRYLFTDRHVALRLPSSELSGEFLGCSEDVLRNGVHVFADASHAPYRFIGRRGITGGAICFGGGLVRGIAKVQGVVCLSSCEAELHALQYAAQETIGFLHLLDRVFTAFGELQGSIDVQMSAQAEDEGGEEQHDKIYTELLTDSQAALDVIHAEDVPKRSRHVEIRLAWMREHLLRGRLKLRWLRGAENAADLYTKNLGTRLFQEHRTRLGFITQDGHVEALYMLSQLRVSPESMKESDEVAAVLEVFCSEDSALCQVCGSLGVPYCGITANAETSRVLAETIKVITAWKNRGLWIHVHVSTPCSSGSPLRNFVQRCTKSDLEWEALMRSAERYLRLGDGRTFELPKQNMIWKRWGTQNVLRASGLVYPVDVWLCATGVLSRSGLPVSKRLRFMCSHLECAQKLFDMFGSCSCQTHASFHDIDYTATGRYSKVLAEGLVKALKATN